MSWTIELHDGRISKDVNEDDILRVFSELTSPDHFILFTNPEVGQIRAAGPHNEEYLIQCDIYENGKKKTLIGEVYAQRSDALSSFIDFFHGNIEAATNFPVHGSNLSIVKVISWIVFLFFIFKIIVGLKK